MQKAPRRKLPTPPPDLRRETLPEERPPAHEVEVVESANAEHERMYPKLPDPNVPGDLERFHWESARWHARTERRRSGSIAAGVNHWDV